jgi:hypothetical protein
MFDRRVARLAQSNRRGGGVKVDGMTKKKSERKRRNKEILMRTKKDEVKK